MVQPVGILLVSICLLHSLFSLQEEDYYAPTMASGEKELLLFKEVDSDSVISKPEIEDGECVFPFWYRNEIFYDCVTFNAKHKWCSLNKTFQGYWKYCSLSDYAQCAFPFWFRRMIYWDCTEDGEVFGKSGVHSLQISTKTTFGNIVYNGCEMMML